ncbi:hypothetical protein GE061_010389 [Apolygus lucorum]|uniref:Uncharacterized protein n=1 Tax=Apolygus lucorum TaxID=248454 RepID=A0A8S9Y383_APOLU|nr:hypothetical protein GE061_010389 [Apolygus lucorum]
MTVEPAGGSAFAVVFSRTASPPPERRRLPSTCTAPVRCQCRGVLATVRVISSPAAVALCSLFKLDASFVRTLQLRMINFREDTR